VDAPGFANGLSGKRCEVSSCSITCGRLIRATLLPGAFRRTLGSSLESSERRPMTLPPAAQACLPPVLHPVSRHILELFLQGWLSPQEFLRLFHLPNSDYLAVSECIVRMLAS
jgi:hypothetical protein